MHLVDLDCWILIKRSIFLTLKTHKISGYNLNRPIKIGRKGSTECMTAPDLNPRCTKACPQETSNFILLKKSGKLNLRNKRFEVMTAKYQYVCTKI